MSFPADHENRVAALDPLRSVCVTAPAGSGKTELLSQRVLVLLARVEQPEEILAITFTKKAAAEMHHRIMTALHMASSEPEPSEPHRKLTWQLARQALANDQQRGWQLLFNPQRLKIQTIDSLCASLTRQMPLMAGFGTQPAIADNLEPAYRKAVRRLLASMEQDSVASEPLTLLVSQLDNNLSKLEALLINLLQQRDQWLFHIFIDTDNPDVRAVLEHTLQQIINHSLQEAAQLLQPFAPELVLLWDYCGNELIGARKDSPATALAGITGLPAASVDQLPQWLGIVESLLKQDGDWRKTVNVNNGFPAQTQDGDKKLAKANKDAFLERISVLSQQPELGDRLREKLADIKKLPSPQYDDGQWQLLSALTTVLPLLVAELRVVFAEQGEVDFVEMSLSALQALGDGLSPTELALRLDHRLKHILIDEFQDTAITQFELLKRLVEGWREHNESDPANPHTLFIVGDGMQSIYGFRQANVGLFLEARYQKVNALKLEDLPLSVNFRSTPTVVEWNNTVFSQSFPPQSDIQRGAVSYEPAIAFSEGRSGSEVVVHGFVGEQARSDEAQFVVQLVQQQLQQAPDDSIAILVKTRNHLADILPALAEAEIPWLATDIDPLADVTPVRDVMLLVRALVNYADDISWLALLRSPFCGLSNRDLQTLCAQAKPCGSLAALLLGADAMDVTAASQPRLARFRQVLQQVHQRRGRRSFREAIEGAWLALGGPTLLASPSEMSWLHSLFDVLETHQQGFGLKSMSLFEAAVTKLYAAPQTTEAKVQVMTIHKSKGLEFDTVILPGLARQPRVDDKELLMHKEFLADSGDSGLVISPLAKDGKNDRIYQFLRGEKKLAQSLENTRLLYVAATRAVKNLYPLFSAGWDEKKECPKDPPSSSLLATIWPAITEQVQWHGEPEAKGEQIDLRLETSIETAELVHISNDWQLPPVNLSKPLAAYQKTREVAGDNLPELSLDQQPRQLGTLLHAVIEQLASRGIEHWQSMSESKRRLWLLAMAAHLKIAQEHLDTTIATVVQAITRMLADERGLWLLSQSHQHALNEYEILSVGEFGVEKNILDRTFIDQNGTRWVVDYKSSAPATGQSLDDFVSTEVASYEKQLRHYAKLVAGLGSGAAGAIKTALYFPLISHWVEL